jgi:hypothetical protein
MFSKQLTLPPNFHINGENVSQLIKFFALVPNHAALYSLRFGELSAEKSMAVRNGGYTDILGRNGRITPKVRLRIEGVSVTNKDVLAAIIHDGRERNLEWSVSISHTVRSSDTEPLNLLQCVADETEGPLSDQHIDDAAIDPGGEAGTESPGYNEPYIISLTSHVEAQRFARAWNMRPFPIPPTESPWIKEFSPRVRHIRADNRHHNTLVRTEVLW